MGGGTITILLYVACCGVVAVVTGTAAGLYAWGRWSDRRKRRRRQAPSEPPAA